eukprot:697916_1
MNYPKYELGPLKVCADHIKPVLQCLIHSILFHRALGVVNPREISSDLFSNISYMTCTNSNVYHEIEEKISTIMQSINKQRQSNQQNDDNSIDIDRILVLFYESKQKEHWFGIGKSETKEYWEQWDIKLNVIKSKKDIDLYTLERNVKANIIKIIEFVGKNYRHLPKLPKEKKLSSPISFPYEIRIPNKNALDDGYYKWVSKGVKSFKRLVENAPQTN